MGVESYNAQLVSFIFLRCEKIIIRFSAKPKESATTNHKLILRLSEKFAFDEAKEELKIELVCDVVIFRFHSSTPSILR